MDLKENLPLLEKIILFEGDKEAVSEIDSKGVEFTFYNEIMEAGVKHLPTIRPF